MSFYKVNLPDEESKIMFIRDKILGSGQTIIYVRTRKSAGMLFKALMEYGFAVTATQGIATQEDRDKRIKEFEDGLTRVLISTDAVARGFDQSQVNLVVNYDLPRLFRYHTEPDNGIYFHRIRDKGGVFNLLCGDTEKMLMEKIERHFNYNFTEVTSWANEDDFKNALNEAGLIERFSHRLLI